MQVANPGPPPNDGGGELPTVQRRRNAESATASVREPVRELNRSPAKPALALKGGDFDVVGGPRRQFHLLVRAAPVAGRFLQLTVRSASNASKVKPGEFSAVGNKTRATRGRRNPGHGWRVRLT